MATETERKFLVKGEFRHLAVKAMEIKQRYLSRDPEKIIRIRIADDKAYLTIKGRPEAGRLMRNEWEFSIPVKDAEDMMELCLPGIIIKTRYLVPHGIHRYEVDVFHGKNEGIVVAELELPDENEIFEIPGWLGKEVTGDPAYYNSNLARE
jgi:adenylate cyclase